MNVINSRIVAHKRLSASELKPHPLNSRTHPDEQRSVFIAHEIEGRSFKELAAETGLRMNTLIARKHYAVLRLRRRLQAIYNEFLNA